MNDKNNNTQEKPSETTIETKIKKREKEKLITPRIKVKIQEREKRKIPRA